MSPFLLGNYMNLIAVICDGNYHSRYYNPEIVTSYQEAIDYFLRNDNELPFDDSVQFLSFSKNTSLERILSDFDNYYREYDECYFDLEEAQQYFDIKIPIYKDGTEIKVYDDVKILSVNVYTAYKHECEYYDAKVLRIYKHYVTIKMNQFELTKPHYMMEKIQ